MGARTASILHLRSHGRESDESAPAVSSNLLVAIVNASGVIDAARVAPLARELGNSVDAGATRVLVDLTRADEATTACMNTLLAARQRLVGRGGEIAVALSPSNERRFESMGLGRRFLLAGNRAEAARLLGLLGGAEPEAGAPAPRSRAA